MLGSRLHLPQHVIDVWTREVARPRYTLLCLIFLSAYFPDPKEHSALSGSTTAEELDLLSHHDASPSVSAPETTISAFIAKGVLGSAVPILQLLGLWGWRLVALAAENWLDTMPLAPRTQSVRLRTRVWAIALILNVAVAVTAWPSKAEATASLLRHVLNWSGIDVAFPLAPHPNVPSALPLRLLVLLDAVTTMASAWAIVMRIEPFMSARISLPSPSHAPSFAKSSLAAFLNRLVTCLFHSLTVRAQQGRQRRLARHRLQVRTPAQRETPPAAAPTLTERTFPAAPSPNTDRSASVPSGPPELPVPAAKPPRQAGHVIDVSLTWVIDMSLALINRGMTALQYTLLLAYLPRFMVSHLMVASALHQQATSLVDIWSNARSSTECLEFVLRRWPASEVPATASQQEEQVCAMCFEPVAPHLAKPDSECLSEEYLLRAHAARRGASQLECGHLLHPACLVSWLSNQSFCPVCHMSLQPVPPVQSRGIHPFEAGFSPGGLHAPDRA